MTPIISVLLPTVRPNLVLGCVRSIAAASEGLPHEVIVVADFDPDPSWALPTTVRWIQCPRRGPVEAVNVAYRSALGEYVFLLNDESILDPRALSHLYRAAIDTPDALLAPEHRPGYRFVYYDRPFVPFPFAHRDVFARLGGLLDLAYRAFYADPDLGLRAHVAGVPIRTVEGSVIRHHNGHDAAKQDNVTAYMAADQATFRARWDHLGEFRDC